MFDWVERDEGQYDDARPVFWTSGACMMIRAETFHAMGGFDEHFFAHMAEIDLCWKINRSGKLLYYTGRSHVYHLGAGTLAYQHPRKTYLNFRNGLTMLAKHLDTGEMLYKLPLRIILDWLASAVFLLKGDVRNAGSVFRAHADVLRHIGKIAAERKRIRMRYPEYSRANIYKGLIVFDYYLRGGKRQVANNPR